MRERAKPNGVKRSHCARHGLVIPGAPLLDARAGQLASPAQIQAGRTMRNGRWSNWLSAMPALLAMGCLSGCAPLDGAEADEWSTLAEDDGGVEALADKAGTSTRYEAESRSGGQGCTQSRAHAGFTGSGFMDFGGNGSWIEWNAIQAPAAGDYELSFRYANGRGENRSAAILVNGGSAGTVSFAPTGGWPTWRSERVKVRLRQGANTVRVQANTGNGGPNLDHVELIASGCAASGASCGGGASACTIADEGRSATLSCSGGATISAIQFASYGTPTGSCQTGHRTGSCHASSSADKVRSACVGKTSCTVAASNAVFSDPCVGTRKQLAVTYTCSTGGVSGDRYPIPAQLPDPERIAPNMTKPVKVYILSGQSNMVGMGDIGPLGTPGTLETLVKSNKKFPNLIDEGGAWTVRNDVWYKGVVSAGANKWLTVGCGAGNGQIGPELGFGHVMGYYHGEPVLIIKASQGNRSLAWDLLPPGSQRYTVDGRTYAGYKDGDDSWSAADPYKDIGTWYAGKQYDDFVTEIHRVLDSFGTNFPQFKNQGYEIAGFAWFQGHKDTGSAVHASRYEINLVNFIRAIRAEFEVPKAPFVIATIGFDGWKMSGNALTVANAQLAVSGEKGKYSDFIGNVLTVETRDYWREVAASSKEQGYHYNRNAETYYLVGEALGRGMAKLRASASR